MLGWVRHMLRYFSISREVKNIEQCNKYIEHKSRNVEMKLDPLAELVKQWAREEEHREYEKRVR
jgi:hypothetical protein